MKATSTAAVAEDLRTIGADLRATAYLIDAVASIDDCDAQVPATRFLAVLAAASKPFSDAVALFQELADDLREIDRGAPSDTGDLAGDEWAVSACRLADQLDDLVAMAEPSGYADPGELLDPTGSHEPLLGHMARIAEIAAVRGDARFTKKVLTWMRSGAEREEKGRLFLLRAKEKTRRWPWNASGAMGSAGGTDHAMTYGRLLPLERQFRATMVRVRQLLGPRRRNKLPEAEALIDQLAASAGPMPTRMHGLILAAKAYIHLLDLTERLGENPPPYSGEELESEVIAAQRLITTSPWATGDDRAGLAWLRRSVRLFAETAVRSAARPKSGSASGARP